jgi:hypothetical protein
MGAEEQRDIVVLFGSNQDNLDQLPYNNFLGNSPQDHLLAIIDLDNLRIHPDERSDIDLDNLGIYLDQRPDIDLDNCGIHPDQRPNINLDIIDTINPAVLNI